MLVPFVKPEDHAGAALVRQRGQIRQGAAAEPSVAHQLVMGDVDTIGIEIFEPENMAELVRDGGGLRDGRMNR